MQLAMSFPKDSATVLELCRPNVPPIVRAAAEEVAAIIAKVT